MVTTRVPWGSIVGYYLVGVLAAAQLGKMSALAPLIAADLGLSLPTAAAAVSLLEIGGATLGTVAGVLAARVGLRAGLMAGLACLALAGLGSAFAVGPVSLLGWRVLEALGYLGVIVTAPVLIAAAAAPSATGVAMAIWSSFVPVGLAAGAALWAALAAAFGWRLAMGGGSGLAWLALAMAGVAAWQARAAARAGRPVARAPRADSPSGSVAGRRAGAAAWLLATSFGCYALFEVGLLALLPLYLTRAAGATVAEAGRWTALASLATILGSLFAAWWIRQGLSLRGPLLVSLLLPALLLFGVFVEAPQLTRVGLLAVLLNAVSGVYPSLAFAWLPQAAGGVERMVRANGLFAQFGASGSLLGPPVMAFFVDRFGWPAAAWCGLVVTLPSTWLAWRLLRRLPGH